jgi:hypothetical protein
VIGIDGLQALQLAMQCAGAVLESTKLKLEWLGQNEDLGMPKFLPWLPKPQQDRLQAIVEREVTKWARRAERAHQAKRSKLSRGRKRIESSRQGLTMRQGPNHAAIWS